MAFTAQDIYNKAISFMDEKSVNGVEIPVSEQADYRLKGIDLLNTAIEEISEVINIDVSKKYNHRHFPNTIEEGTGYEGNVHDKEDVVYTASNLSTGYYFEVDGDADVRVEVYNPILNTWRAIATIVVDGVNGEFKAYKGILEGLAVETLTRMIFSGDYYYRIGNVALYNRKVKDIIDIPTFKEWIKVEFDTSVISINSITDMNKQNINESNYRVEDDATKVYLRNDYEANIIINYSGTQSEISVYEDEILFEHKWKPILSYYLVGHLLLGDGEDSSQYYIAKYEEQLTKAKDSVESELVELSNYWSFTY